MKLNQFDYQSQRLLRKVFTDLQSHRELEKEIPETCYKDDGRELYLIYKIKTDCHSVQVDRPYSYGIKETVVEDAVSHEVIFVCGELLKENGEWEEVAIGDEYEPSEIPTIWESFINEIKVGDELR